MNYYVLTDALHAGEVIRVDGRRHYRFVFGSYQWERTTAFQAYLTQGTDCFGKYREITETQAQELLVQRGKLLSAWLQKADAIAEQAHRGQVDKSGRPYIEHPRAVAEALNDWEEKIVALLHDICEDTPWTVESLRAAGFSERICVAVDLLTRPDGMSYEAYLGRIRNNRLARNVKLADLGHNMDLQRIPNPTAKDRERAEVYRKARQYLFGDIPVAPQKAGEGAEERPVKAILSSKAIYQQLYPLALGGRKVPHGISNPVLRIWQEKLCLAFFVYTFSREDLHNGSVTRPISWMVADLENGQMLEEIPCSKEDFSSAGMKERFSTNNPNGTQPADFFQQTYAILDGVRQEYAETGNVNQSEYERYMEQMLRAVPPAYHRFYRELSKP